jgi:uncharacterized protein YbjT (DUF2867 family)
MAYVVAGVSGNTGKVVASTLLAAGKKVRVLVRDAAKGQAWKDQGAEVAVAELSDADAVAKALSGAEGAYLLSPPAFGVPDVLAHGRAVIDAVAIALEKSPVAHVAWLSSVGAHHEAGTGPIRTAHYAETTLSKLKTPITFVRAAYFQENWGSVAGAAKAQGILPSFLTPGRAISQVATPDIGRVAAEALIEGPRGLRHIELEGPARYTPEEVAASFGRALEKHVQLVSVPEAGIIGALREVGFTEDLAGLYDEMIRGVNRGHVDFATKDIVRGRIGLDETVRLLVKLAADFTLAASG